LHHQFIKFDIEQNGIITINEMILAMKAAGYPHLESDITKLLERFRASDVDDIANLHINYSEFIAATLDSKMYLDKEKLWMMFQYFDTDSSGDITVLQYFLSLSCQTSVMSWLAQAATCQSTS
jgi:calcium-dependent protein kinase